MLLVNLLLNDSLSQQISEITFAANLFALKKKDGGLRPIAVAPPECQMCELVCVNKLSINFAPIQLGVRSGAETAVHATRRYVSSMSTENVMVKLDFSNAFNTLRRNCMFEVEVGR